MVSTYLLLGEIVREVGDHHLGLGGDAISGGTTLTSLAGLARSLGLGVLCLGGRGRSGVRSIGRGKSLSGRGLGTFTLATGLLLRQ